MNSTGRLAALLSTLFLCRLLFAGFLFCCFAASRLCPGSYLLFCCLLLCCLLLRSLFGGLFLRRFLGSLLLGSSFLWWCWTSSAASTTYYWGRHGLGLDWFRLGV